MASALIGAGACLGLGCGPGLEPPVPVSQRSQMPAAAGPGNNANAGMSAPTPPAKGAKPPADESRGEPRMPTDSPADATNACTPDCSGRECGSDGCGGACGVCADGSECKDGACTCSADCDAGACGDAGEAGACAGSELEHRTD